jgi:hypothetical protein
MSHSRKTTPSNSPRTIEHYVEISAAEERKEIPTNHCSRFDRYTILRLFLYGGPVLGFLAALLEDADGLAKLSDGKLFGFIPLEEGSKQTLAVIVPTIYGLVLVGLNKEWTVPGANLTLDCIRNRRLPTDWPQLSRNKQWAGFALCGLYSYAVFADAIATAYFIDIMPEIYHFESKINANAWKVWAYSAGIVASLATFCSETLDTAKLTWELLNGEFGAKMPQGWQEWLALVLGLPIGLAGSLADSITMYFAVGKQFAIQNYNSQLALFIINGFLNTFPDFIFNGRRAIIEPLEKFLKKISNGVTCTEALIFIPVTAFSLLVAEGFRHLLHIMISDPEIPVPASPSDIVKEILAILYFINSLIYCESYLYQLGPYFSAAWQSLTSCFSWFSKNNYAPKESRVTELVSPATQSPEENEEEMSSNSDDRPEGVARAYESHDSDEDANPPPLNVSKSRYALFNNESNLHLLPTEDDAIAPQQTSRKSWCTIM